MFVLALSLYNTWNRGVFLLCKITNLLIYSSQIKKGGELDIFLRHGIIKERMSALLTDSIRACVLEDMGYSVDLIEFIDFEHSPKNIMIRAVRDKGRGTANIERAKALTDRYGFRQTLLELCGKKEE